VKKWKMDSTWLSPSEQLSVDEGWRVKNAGLPTETSKPDHWWTDDKCVAEVARKHAGGPDGEGWRGVWKSNIEPAAFRYEVLRRNGFDTLPPWPQLPERLLCFVVGALRDEMPKASWRLHPISPTYGWATMEPRAWNLNASDEALRRSFMAFINRHRQLQGIQPTTSRNRGRRNRPISWRAVEAMDERTMGGKLNDSDRSNVAHARSSAKPYAVRLGSALHAAKGFAHARI
jgi:hypothetical protein